MLQVISARDCPMTVVALARNNLFYCKGVVPDRTTDLVWMDTIATGETRLVARKDLIMVVEGLQSDSHTVADCIKFIREDRTKEGAGSLLIEQSSDDEYSDVRQVLMEANVPKVKYIGGFRSIPIYGDEIAIAVASWSSYGWILRQKDVDRYRKAIKNIEAEELGRLRVWHEIHIDQDGHEYPVVRIEGWSEPPLHDDVTVLSVSEYAVVYNIKSRIVQRILLTNGHVESLPCERGPIRSIVLGKRLPECLARGE